MKSFTVKENTNLKDFTSAVYPQGAFCLNALLKGKDVKVNGVRVNKNVLLKAGDGVTYYTTPAQEAKPSHFTVYEDENVYIADKLSGVSSEGLSSELDGYFPCHRLDRNTQGLMTFAKTREAEEEILSAFKERRVEKIYLALCRDCFEEKSGVLTAYLVKDEKASRVKIFDGDVKGGVKIVTEFEVIKRESGLALVRVTLHTGKTHQIRAHLAHIGCPVLGDEKYGDEALNEKYGAKRQRLVAKYLSFCFDGRLRYLNEKTFESSFVPAP